MTVFCGGYTSENYAMYKRSDIPIFKDEILNKKRASDEKKWIKPEEMNKECARSISKGERSLLNEAGCFQTLFLK